MARNYPGKPNRRPLGLWHDIHPGVRSAFISFGIVLPLFVCNGLAASLFSSTSQTTALIFYPIQMLFYFVNGMIAGWQADETRKADPSGIRRRKIPNYMAIGAVAGFSLAILAALVYFLADQTASQLLPGLQLTGLLNTPWLYIAIDIIASVGLGMLGGVVYANRFALPAR